MNNPIWIMTSAFKDLNLDEIIMETTGMEAQGFELCVFRRDGDRKDHVATHLDYESFGPDDAKAVLERCNEHELKLSIGAYENLIGGDESEMVKNQDHLLKLIRMAHLMGGDDNDVIVGTFVGYNHQLGIQDHGFEKNLEAYVKVFKPIIEYAESLGVSIAYENCPMEGWMPASTSTTYNNLPATLAARKLMYALIPNRAHGETYDPSHDVWQHIDPVDVIKLSDMSRIRRIHVKATRLRMNKARIHWGGLYPMQSVNRQLAKKAGVPVPMHEWDRHHYEPMLPGFGGSDSMDWRAFLNTLNEMKFDGPFVIENEADNSAHTLNYQATVQGFRATVLNLAPMIWQLDETRGYSYKSNGSLKMPVVKDVPVVTMKDIM